MKTVLFFPTLIENQYPLWAPLSIMSIAASLKGHGDDFAILDDRLSERPDDAVCAAAKEAGLFGISIRPGNQVERGLRAAELVKRVNPDCSVVIGGWYGSIRGELMVDHPAVDYVIRGNGDRAILELLEAMAGEREFNDVKGLLWKEKGKIRQAEWRKLEDINDTFPMPYDLIPVEKHLTREREINYISSRGCPGSCEFCAVKCIYKEEWTGLAPERMLDEISRLVTDYDVKRIHFTDTDFFADIDRAISFCEEILRRNIDFKWWALGRVATMIEQNDEFYDLLRRAGCYCIEVGAESGSDSVLEMYQKGIHPGDLVEFTRILNKHGIGGSMNWMLGPPGESRRDFYNTFKIAAKIQKLKPDMHYLFFRFSPIPTSTLGEKALKTGMRIPEKGSELPQFKYYVDLPIMPWLSSFHERRIKRAFYFYFPLAFWTPDSDDSSLKTRILKFLKKSAHIRLRMGILAFPFEWWIYWLFVKAGLLAEGRLYAWR